MRDGHDVYTPPHGLMQEAHVGLVVLSAPRITRDQKYLEACSFCHTFMKNQTSCLLLAQSLEALTHAFFVLHFM
jgi:hypothetical protein